MTKDFWAEGVSKAKKWTALQWTIILFLMMGSFGVGGWAVKKQVASKPIQKVPLENPKVTPESIPQSRDEKPLKESTGKVLGESVSKDDYSYYISQLKGKLAGIDYLLSIIPDQIQNAENNLSSDLASIDNRYNSLITQKEQECDKIVQDEIDKAKAAGANPLPGTPEYEAIMQMAASCYADVDSLKNQKEQDKLSAQMTHDRIVRNIRDQEASLKQKKIISYIFLINWKVESN